MITVINTKFSLSHQEEFLSTHGLFCIYFRGGGKVLLEVESHEMFSIQTRADPRFIYPQCLHVAIFHKHP